METLGIIAEYNPFHRGHKYLIEEACRQTGIETVVSVMSGDFMQRGFPAAFDKWKRARAAVEGGVDLVVELPVLYACNSANWFAMGGVSILEGLGVDILAFGSENGKIEELKKTAEVLRDSDKSIHIDVRKLVKHGMSYPSARNKALSERSEFDSSIISEPNNILAVEYIQRLSSMSAFTVKRVGTEYNEEASAMRKKMEEENPSEFNERQSIYFKLLASKVMEMSGDQLEDIFAAGNGLGHKLKAEIRYSSSLEDLIDRVKSKAYTRTRVMRLMSQTILGIDGKAMSESGIYARVLAMNENGARFLRTVKGRDENTIPIITNINKETFKFPEIAASLEKDIFASDMYNLIIGADLYGNSDLVMMPKVVDNRSR